MDDCAFQQDAFQNDAFQAVCGVEPTPSPTTVAVSKAGLILRAKRRPEYIDNEEEMIVIM